MGVKFLQTKLTTSGVILTQEGSLSHTKDGGIGVYFFKPRVQQWGHPTEEGFRSHTNHDCIGVQFLYLR